MSLTPENETLTPGSLYTGRDNLEVKKYEVHYNELLLKWIRSHAVGTSQIVDFGAGTGMFAIPLAEAGHRVYCVELDPGYRSALREHGLHAGASLDGLSDASVDFIYAFDVLEHIEDDLACLEHCYRKLRPGGRLLVYVPAFPVLYGNMDRQVGHYRRYRLRVLRARCQAAGFAVDDASYVDCLGFLGSLAYKLTSRGTGTVSWRAASFYDHYIFRLSRMLDPLLGRWVGKNLLISARKRDS